MHCHRPCTSVYNRMRIHRACNNARIEEQRTSSSHAKRVREEESPLMASCPPRLTQRLRIEASRRGRSLAAPAAHGDEQSAVDALFVLRTPAR